MRPTYQILSIAFDYLYYQTPERNHCSTRICHALVDANEDDVISDAEYTAATTVVMHAVRELDSRASYLRTAAITAGLLPAMHVEYCASTSRRYIEFRDNWLRQLIEKEKKNAIPESPTPRDESTQ